MKQWSNGEGESDSMVNNDQTASLSRSLEPLVPAWYGDEVSDVVLLDRFVEQWDQAAFRDLVRRHGPMVLGVCRRILRDPHAAEDAFQATFLLLVRKASSIRKRESVGPWLHGVAQRVALEARGVAARRELPAPVHPEVSGVDNHDDLERDELHAALQEELGRLPEKYRAPLVLCYIEGLPHESVARQLGWPLGTVRVRIARGRDLLGARLIRRGLTPAAVLVVLSLLPTTAAAVPLRLVEATVRAAARVVAGEKVARGEIPARVVDLERNVRNAMHLTGLKWATVISLAVIATGAGVAAIVPRALAAADDAAKVAAELKKLQGTWLFASFEQAGVKKEVQGNEEQIKIEGEVFSIWHDGHVEESGKVKVDPSKNPSEIDFEFQDGKKGGKTDLAIYAWDGANLKLCWVRDGDKHPSEFATKPGDKCVLVILKRQDP
jgi:RNA polymerase sigma factor (sigma-70 family)